jgi:glutamyl-tRNA reductase
MGLNHKTAPIDVREKFTFHEEDISHFLKILKQKEGVMECVILSTCNRVEIYSLLAGEKLHILKTSLCDYRSFEGEIDQFIYSYKNEEAFKHLCKVSSGLDSMVIGEPQIFGQVKEAYRIALECDCVGSVFKSFFPQAFSVVKKVRSKTGIGLNNVSVSYAAVNLAKKIFSDIKETSVMILGAGEMGELTVRNLISNGVKEIFVSNRTFQKAVQLADLFHGTPVMFYEIFEYIPKVDIIISSISAPDYIIKIEDIEKIIPHRNKKPLFIIDISVPRSIDPKVNSIENVYLYNIDDLKSVVETTIRIRKKEAEKANQIINKKANDLMKNLSSQDILPAILFLRTTAEDIRKQECDKIIRKMNTGKADKDKIDSLTKSIMNKILDQAIIKMREYSNIIKYK